LQLSQLRKFHSAACTALVAVFFATSTRAQNLADAVRGYVKAEMRRQQIPGLALLVVKNGKIARAEGFGMANVELPFPVKPETVFQSGRQAVHCGRHHDARRSS
jgi:CubicO group peptidase (beta-lactamase class C family)